jgi:uncharacterized protein (DUF1330 family)
MPAYVLFIRDQPVRDAAAMEAYRNSKRGRDPKMVPLVVYGATEAVEGEAPDGVVILQFPTVEDAKNWYYSPEYQAATQLRKKGADYRVVIVQGI